MMLVQIAPSQGLLWEK